MSTVQAPLLSEGETWFRSGRSFSRTSFDFSCFEEDGVFDYDSLDSLLAPASNNAPIPAVHTPANATPAPTLMPAPQEEFKYAPHQFPEVRMWPQVPMHQQLIQQPAQEPRFVIQHHSPEFQTPHRPVIHQNLLSNSPPQPQMVTPAFQENAHNAMDANYEMADNPANKPVKLENFANRDQYYQQQPMCDYTHYKSSEEMTRDCSSPLSDGEVKSSPQKSSQYTFMDITPYMTLPQAEAARQLGIPVSTLSKRWRVATGRRKWPWRVVSKLDKEITTLLYNINIGTGKDKDKDLEERLSYLLAKREKALRSVRIRISNKCSS